METGMRISASNYTVKRISFISEFSFEMVVTRFDSLIGHPDMLEFGEKMRKATSAEDLIQVVQEAVGEVRLMEFI